MPLAPAYGFLDKLQMLDRCVAHQALIDTMQRSAACCRMHQLEWLAGTAWNAGLQAAQDFEHGAAKLLFEASAALHAASPQQSIDCLNNQKARIGFLQAVSPLCCQLDIDRIRADVAIHLVNAGCMADGRSQPSACQPGLQG